MTSETPKMEEPGERILWRAAIRLPRWTSDGAIELCSAVFEDMALSVSTLDLDREPDAPRKIEILCAQKPERGEIVARLALLAVNTGIQELASPLEITIDPLPDRDWLMHVHESFPPMTVGSFYIYGSHYEGALPKDKIALKIDAATAFGSGEHETTRSCLLAMEALKKSGLSPVRVLDMGCGSGILAVAATKLWPHARVCAVDIEEESVRVTRRHAEFNGVQMMIAAEAADGFSARLVQENAPFDLIIANILARPLIAMATALSTHLARGGYALLSGLLADQKADVVRAYETSGLTLQDAIAINEWQALVLQKGGKSG